jgi:maltooligosyltrehalose trehalohydrolase
MLKYYQQLIAVRKSQPALRTPDRKGVEVDVDEANETLILYRRSSEQEIICLLNFSKQEQTMQPRIQGEWKKLFDSADLMWRGPKAATDSLAAGNNFNVQPESIIIYTNKIF